MLRATRTATFAISLTLHWPGLSQAAEEPCANTVLSIDAACTAGPQYAVPTTRERAGRIAVPVRVNGQGPFRFLLDTGANRSAVTNRVAQTLGLVVIQDGVIVQGVNGRVVAGLVHVDSLNIGGMTATDLRLPVLDGETFDGLDGSLGADLLANLRLTANFDTDTVTLSTRHPIPDPVHYGVVKTRRVSSWLVQAEGRARSAGFQMILDTGANRTLGNAALYRALTGHPLSSSHALHIAVNDATRTHGDGLVVNVSPIVLGSLVVENSTVAFGDYPVFEIWGLARKPALLLGMDVIGRLKELTIDYQLHTIEALPR